MNFITKQIIIQLIIKAIEESEKYISSERGEEKRKYIIRALMPQCVDVKTFQALDSADNLITI